MEQVNMGNQSNELTNQENPLYVAINAIKNGQKLHFNPAQGNMNIVENPPLKRNREMILGI